jgi:ribosomal protein L44E
MADKTVSTWDPGTRTYVSSKVHSFKSGPKGSLTLAAQRRKSRAARQRPRSRTSMAIPTNDIMVAAALKK